MLLLNTLDVPNWLLISTTLLIALYYYGKRPFYYWTRRGVQGPPMLPFIGDFPTTLKLGFAKQMMMQIGKYGKIHGSYFLNRPSLVVADIDMLKQICIKESDCFTDRESAAFIAKPLNRGIIALKGQEWKRVRNLLTPAFTTGKLKAMFPLVDSATETLCRQLVISEDEEIAIYDYCVNFTLEVIASTMFGLKIDCQENPNNSFKRYGKRMFEIFDVGAVNLKFIFLLLFPSIAGPIYSKLNIDLFPREASNFFLDVISQALKVRQKEENKGKYTDFLASMVTAREDALQCGLIESEDVKGLSEDEVLAQSLIFFLAGFETTANAMQLVLYFLSWNLECQEKCLEEIQSVGELNYENVMQLKYLGQCIDEALRLCPPAVLTDRVCTKPTTVRGYDIEPGMNIRVPIYFLAHDPDLWEEPETFNPDRFSPEQAGDRDPLSFIPFGIGPRSCIGMRLAYIELRKALAEMLLHFDFKPGDETPTFEKLEFKQAAILAPKKQIYLKIRSR